MSFRSIVFQKTEDAAKSEGTTPPGFFIDLRLDQIVEAITASKEEYNLKRFFYTPLNDIDAVKYRHEVFLDLENKTLFQHIELFAQRMRAMREYSAWSSPKTPHCEPIRSGENPLTDSHTQRQLPKNTGSHNVH